MILSKGVTGFCYDLPQLKINDVKRDCYSVIHIVGGKIEDVIDIQYPRNFYEVVLRIREEYFHALFNSQYPLIAFASNVDYFHIMFTDESQLTHAFKKFSYRVLSVNELNTPLCVKQTKKKIIVENENDLNDTELKQIQYWKPKTVGDIIFNFWD